MFENVYHRISLLVQVDTAMVSAIVDGLPTTSNLFNCSNLMRLFQRYDMYKIGKFFCHAKPYKIG